MFNVKRNAFYAQSGGVTAVINASACGVIQAARHHSDRIGNLYAGRNGILGALREELYDTGKESTQSIAELMHTPGGAFGSCRYKMQDPATSDDEYQRLVEVFAGLTVLSKLLDGQRQLVDKLVDHVADVFLG